MTKSIPSISSSGNLRPQSITTISSLYSIAVIFLPISFIPPNGITLIMSFSFRIFSPPLFQVILSTLTAYAVEFNTMIFYMKIIFHLNVMF